MRRSIQSKWKPILSLRWNGLPFNSVILLGSILALCSFSARPPKDVCPPYNVTDPSVCNRASEICGTSNKVATNLYYVCEE